MKNTIEYVRQICIKREKEIDSAIFMKIKDIAIENGIKTEYLLNEKAIINALEKQIPKRPIKDEYNFLHCPHCNYDDFALMHDSSFADRYNHCHHCGQRLDWGDSE